MRDQPASPTPPPVPCTNCGASVQGAYCSDCGERQPDLEQLKLKTFAAHAVEEITDVEHSKLLRTLRSLLTRPGQLTVEFLQGRRKSYLGPFKFYLVIFALTLIAYSVYRPAAVYDVRTFMETDTSGSWQKLMADLSSEVEMPLETFVREVNGRWRSLVSLTQVLYPLFVAVALHLLYLNRNRFLVEHLVFSLHYLTFLNVTFLLFWPAYAVAGIKPGPTYYITIAASLIWSIVYLILAVRRAYRETLRSAIWKSLVVYVAYFIATIFVTYLLLAAAVLWLALETKAG